MAMNQPCAPDQTRRARPAAWPAFATRPRFGRPMPLRPDCCNFDLHEPPRVRQASDLHRGPGGKPGLVRSAEELAVALHEAVEVHPAVLCRVADQEHGHVDHVAQRQSQPL